MNTKRALLLGTLSMLLCGCIQTGRYHIKQDLAPLRKPTAIEMQNATPRPLPLYPLSIKPYTVNNQRYYPLQSATGYLAQGTASWYGRKFHGHKTANGEIYDMFAMTAAHKHLPLPSFVEVTNLDNNRSIIVKINDRGPFHGDRLIDLSYSAAYALDILKKGTGTVKLQTIALSTPPSVPQLFIQIAASGNKSTLQTLGEQLFNQYGQSFVILAQDKLFKLHIGPLQSKPQAQALADELKNNGHPNAYMLYSSKADAHN